MTIHLFILSSAVQMYEFSYIHFQTTGMLHRNQDCVTGNLFGTSSTTYHNENDFKLALKKMLQNN